VTYTVRCVDQEAGAETELTFFGKCYTERDFAFAFNKANNRRWIKSGDMPAMIPLPTDHSIVYVFPNDPELVGLPILAAPKKIQRLLYEHMTEFPKDEWRISDRRLSAMALRYKPEKRAVLKLDTRVVHRSNGTKTPLTIYMRVYCDKRGEAVFGLMQDLRRAVEGNPEVTVPEPIVYVEDKRMLMMRALDGTPLTEKMADAGSRELLVQTAHAIEQLHRLHPERLPIRSAEDVLQDAEATGRTIAHVHPGAASLVTEILDRLRASRPVDEPGATVFVHGDFYDGQVLVGANRTGVLDFDRSYLGDPVADIGNFCAHLRLRFPNDVGLAEVFAEAWADAAGRSIGRAQLGFWTAFGLFQLAVRPFRTLAPNWKARISNILEDCRNTFAEI
jgi:aminoglycoside phosphotransferase (APT) family kinase protein